MTPRQLLSKYPLANDHYTRVELSFYDEFGKKQISVTTGEKFFSEEGLDEDLPELEDATIAWGESREIEDDRERISKSLSIALPRKEITVEALQEVIKRLRRNTEKDQKVKTAYKNIVNSFADCLMHPWGPSNFTIPVIARNFQKNLDIVATASDTYLHGEDMCTTFFTILTHAHKKDKKGILFDFYPFACEELYRRGCRYEEILTGSKSVQDTIRGVFRTWYESLDKPTKAEIFLRDAPYEPTGDEEDFCDVEEVLENEHIADRFVEVVQGVNVEAAEAYARGFDASWWAVRSSRIKDMRRINALDKCYYLNKAVVQVFQYLDGKTEYDILENNHFNAEIKLKEETKK